MCVCVYFPCEPLFPVRNSNLIAEYQKFYNSIICQKLLKNFPIEDINYIVRYLDISFVSSCYLILFHLIRGSFNYLQVREHARKLLEKHMKKPFFNVR